MLACSLHYGSSANNYRISAAGSVLLDCSLTARLSVCVCVCMCPCVCVCLCVLVCVCVSRCGVDCCWLQRQHCAAVAPRDRTRTAVRRLFFQDNGAVLELIEPLFGDERWEPSHNLGFLRERPSRQHTHLLYWTVGGGHNHLLSTGNGRLAFVAVRYTPRGHCRLAGCRERRWLSLPV